MVLQTASPLVLDLQTHQQNSDITRGTEEGHSSALGRGEPHFSSHMTTCHSTLMEAFYTDPNYQAKE